MRIHPAAFRRMIESLSAGFPSPAEGYEDEPLNIHNWIVRNPAATFFYRVEGHHLNDEHICDGSILIVDRSISPTPGKLVLIEADGEFVVVRLNRIIPTVVCGVVTGVVTRL